MNIRVGISVLLLLICVGLVAPPLNAVSFRPISDRELRSRADAVVRGIVVSSRVREDASGRPETVTVIKVLEVLKGKVPTALVLHQLGGELPDGRSLRLYGRPEYQQGHEVVVFAIARPEGDYQTAEFFLGKFEIQNDESGASFAVPAIPVAALAPPSRLRAQRKDGHGTEPGIADPGAPRELSRFLQVLRGRDLEPLADSGSPRGELRAVLHSDGGLRPLWANLPIPLLAPVRWNGATAVWTLEGELSGDAELMTSVMATWNDEPNSDVNYSIGPGSSNLIHLNAAYSPCGWYSCYPGIDMGLINCGMPTVSGAHSWRGETYGTITGGEAWVRCGIYGYTPPAMTNVLGYTLGLGHPEQGASVHDVCRGDEGESVMLFYITSGMTLGTDDQDALRWLYGDGGNSCDGVGAPVLNVTKAGSSIGTVTSVPPGISCGTACSSYFVKGTLLSLAATAVSGSVFQGWSGDADCADGLIVMDVGESCIATFNIGSDLIVSALTAPKAGVSGSTITVTDSTKNQTGKGTTAVTTTGFYLSSDATWSVGDILLGGRSIPVLAPGKTNSASTTLTVPVGTATGTYFLIAKADGGGVLAELYETNNTRSVSIKLGPPDLIVSFLSVPARSGAGLSFIATNTTRNQGTTVPTAASVTRFSLSANTTLDAADPTIGNQAIGPLNAGASEPHSTSLTIPAGTTAGAYYVIARADANNILIEANENNNTVSTAILIGPDLIVTALTAPTNGGVGLPIIVTDTVKNQGGSLAAVSTIGFFLSANATFEPSDVALGGRGVPSLGPGVINSGSTTLIIPAIAAAGTYYVLAVADAPGAVVEASETNNTKSATIKLAPDLIVSALSATASSPVGRTITIKDTTRNNGVSSAPASVTTFSLSANTTHDAGDVSIGSRAVPALASGIGHPASTLVVIPASTTPGDYYVLAQADAGSAVAETGETNNWRASNRIKLLAGPADPALEADRVRIFDTWTAVNLPGAERCAAWTSLSWSQKQVFLTITHRLKQYILARPQICFGDFCNTTYEPLYTPGGTMLSHVRKLHQIRGFNSGSEDCFNLFCLDSHPEESRLIMSADQDLYAALALAFRWAIDLPGLAGWSKSPLSTNRAGGVPYYDYFRNSHDLSGHAHAPFDQSNESRSGHFGDAPGNPTAQLHFFSPDSNFRPWGGGKAFEAQPRFGGLTDPYLLEMDQDWGVCHWSDPASCGHGEEYFKHYGDYLPDWYPPCS